MIRLGHGAVAVGFGAIDAVVSAKVAQAPLGVPAPVWLEGLGVAAGWFGGKVGIDADIRDPLLVSSLALAGSRLTRVAMAGKLAQGPRAWGGDMDAAAAALPAAGGRGSLPAGRPAVRALGPGAVGGSLSLYPPLQERSGVAG